MSTTRTFFFPFFFPYLFYFSLESQTNDWQNYWTTANLRVSCGARRFSVPPFILFFSCCCFSTPSSTIERAQHEQDYTLKCPRASLRATQGAEGLLPPRTPPLATCFFCCLLLAPLALLRALDLRFAKKKKKKKTKKVLPQKRERHGDGGSRAR